MMDASKKRAGDSSTAAPSKRVKADAGVFKPVNGLVSTSGSVLFWFRTDLRLNDNTGLNAAVQASVVSGKPLVALFVISPGEWSEHDLSPAKVWFILRSLEHLKKELEELGIPLCVRSAETRQDVPGVVLDTVDRINATAAYWNKEYEVHEAARDRKVEHGLSDRKVSFASYDDQCIVPPGLVRTKENRVYTVFNTHEKGLYLFKLFYRWIVHLTKKTFSVRYDIATNHESSYQRGTSETIESLSIPIPDELPSHKVPSDLLENIKVRFPPGEVAGLKKAHGFYYKSNRDIPSLDGTSSLSPYLAAALAANANKFDSGNDGAVTWISELCWRDFYKYILVEFPRVCKNQPFLQWTENVPWQEDEEKFKRWCEGKTGYPIVDAGMRQLAQIGWMHNRLRMVTAMFLVKDLGIDWRKGERWFMQHLIDGDLASNNGGCSGHPCQSGKKALHDPSTLGAKKIAEIGYVKKIVDHKVASTAIKELFKIAHQASK
ncbi:DNA photolyase, FAD-binding/Cryptochrome [Chytridium lagenaria]|nr:DNA photolyase, FAD-binding/Cryptochrome [Chytridium lagenaria]